MGRRETHGKYNKTKGAKLYERTLSLEDLLGTPRPQSRQLLELTVGGFIRGMVQMQGKDGVTYLCSKENARGALYGDTVAAERIGREKVVVRKVLAVQIHVRRRVRAVDFQIIFFRYGQV